MKSGWRHGFARIGAPAPLAGLMLLVFALLTATYGYFLQNEYSYNVVCRAGLAANMVQHGRVDIDDYAHMTQDLSIRDGVYYCDKAPGMSFLGAPAAFLFTSVLPIDGATAEEGSRWPMFLYVLTLTTSVFWSAFAGMVLLAYLHARTGDAGAALIGVLAYGLATPVFGWATSFFSHAAAGAFLLLGFIGLDTAARRIGTGKRVIWPAVAGGLALGTSVSVEYTSAIAALIIGAVIGLGRLKRETLAPLLRLFAAAVAAAFLAIIPTLIYHHAAFGSPFTTGYGFAAVYEETRSGLFGVRWPDPAIIGELIAGARRGLVWYAPAAVAAIAAGALAWWRKDARAALIASALILSAFLFINGGFAYWLGGASTGPRYLTPALAFTGLALGLSWPALGLWTRRAVLALLAVSVFISLASVAVDMTVTEEHASPLTDRIFPLFFQGALHQTMIYKALKLDGLITLLPLMLIWAGLGWLIWREAAKAGAAFRDAGAASS